MKTHYANQLVTVQVFQSEIEAELAKAKLMNSGIESYVFKNDCGGKKPHMKFTLGVDLKVRRVDYALVSEKLGAVQTSEGKTGEMKSRENKASIYLLLALVLCFMGCSQFLISYPSEDIKYSIGAVLLGIGIIFGIYSVRTKKKDLMKKL
jgi:hypothetical protein